MSKAPSTFQALSDALRCLPGVGPKSAQRMAYHLVQRDRPGAQRLADALTQALQRLRHCERCNTLTEQVTCDLCSSPKRDPSLLCVIETPADQLMMEQSQAYNGLYFILLGRLSPLDGVGPKEIQLDKLLKRAADGVVSEVVLATNFTVEGEATAHYVSELLRGRGVRVTRIARGMPLGGELEHVDSGTLAQAVYERREV